MKLAMNYLGRRGMMLDHVVPATSQLHDVRGRRPLPEMSDTLRTSYLMTLPFFNMVAVATNCLIFCIFSSAQFKRYRSSVFFRFLALVDAGQSFLTFGLMWLTIVFPEPFRSAAETNMHCRMYTVLRYTAQDLSAYGLVCLVMERCSAMSSRSSSRPACVLMTLGQSRFVLRHLSCKLFLFCVSVLILVLNMGMVLSDHQLLDPRPVLSQCFNTWKSPSDFTYTFSTLAMNHALLSMVIPAMCLVVAYLCLRVLLARQPALPRSAADAMMLGNLRQGGGGGRPPAPLEVEPRRRRSGRRRPICPVFHTRWFHLDLSNTGTATGTPLSSSPSPPLPPPAPILTLTPEMLSAAAAFRPPLPVTYTPPPPSPPSANTTNTTATTTSTTPALPRTPTLTLMCVDEVPGSEIDDDGGGDDGGGGGGGGDPRASGFLDRLYDMIKRREFVVSIVSVEDSRLSSEPSPALCRDLNAMASVAAIFFIMLVQPHLLLMMVGCILRHSNSSGGYYNHPPRHHHHHHHYHRNDTNGTSGTNHTSGLIISMAGSHAPPPPTMVLDWSLVRNVGLAADLVFNNRVSFTLFLFLFVSGTRVSNCLVAFLRRLSSSCCCCGGFFCRLCHSCCWSPRGHLFNFRRLRRGGGGTPPSHPPPPPPPHRCRGPPPPRLHRPPLPPRAAATTTTAAGTAAGVAQGPSSAGRVPFGFPPIRETAAGDCGGAGGAHGMMTRPVISVLGQAIGPTAAATSTPGAPTPSPTPRQAWAVPQPGAPRGLGSVVGCCRAPDSAVVVGGRGAGGGRGQGVGEEVVPRMSIMTPS